jgi:hypothetical protein
MIFNAVDLESCRGNGKIGGEEAICMGYRGVLPANVIFDYLAIPEDISQAHPGPAYPVPHEPTN